MIKVVMLSVTVYDNDLKLQVYLDSPQTVHSFSDMTVVFTSRL